MKYKLGEICEIVSGSTPKTTVEEYWDGDIKWITPAEITEDSYIINDSARKITELGVKKTGLTPFPEGTVILSSRAPIGKVAIAGCEMYCNQGFKNLICSDKINNKYLYWFLRGNTDFLNSLGRGATFKEISKGIVSEILINVPDIDDQIAAVNNLEKLSSIMKLRKQELEELDCLIKARFVEMFGNLRNSDKYIYVSFEELVDYMGDIGSNGANKVVVEHLDMKDEEDYALMVRFLNFTKNDFSEDVKYISKESYDFFKKSQLHGGELIFCKIGSAGLNYIMPYLNRPVSLGLNQIMVRINEKALMPYLYQYLHTDYGEYLISGCINGAVTKSITKTELKKIPVMLPPIDEQREFAEFVEQVDKSKVVIQKALDEMQLLFNDLMQEYFGGGK
jgi:type I restriction enzyme S subunit